MRRPAVYWIYCYIKRLHRAPQVRSTALQPAGRRNLWRRHGSSAICARRRRPSGRTHTHLPRSVAPAAILRRATAGRIDLTCSRRALSSRIRYGETFRRALQYSAVVAFRRISTSRSLLESRTETVCSAIVVFFG